MANCESCGPNCLYLLLRAHGYERDYADLLDLDVTQRGTNLIQLRRKAEDLDVRTEIRRMSPEDLRDIESPIIVHLDGFMGDMTRSGHFMLVTSYDTEQDVVTAFDGTTTKVVTMHADQFVRSWTGNALVVAESMKVASLLWAWSGGLLFGLVIRFGYLHFSRGRELVDGRVG